MAGGQTAVRVFVDDAVLGRFPPVCAATGTPSDGWTTVHAPVGGSGLSPWAWLLLLLGPVGWVIFLLVCVSAAPSERLSVSLPWTEAVHVEVGALRRRRAAAVGVALTAAAVFVAALALPVGSLSMTVQVIAVAGAAVTVGAVGVALAARTRIRRRTPTVDLDGSRRWVTLRNVDAGFVRAVVADQAARAVPR